MRARVFLRIAPTSRGFKVIATSKPSHAPISDGYGVLPTIAFGLVLNIADDAFRVPQIAELDVPANVPVVSAEVERHDG